MIIQFKDYFSARAADYAETRPRYPAELFGWLARVVPDRDLAWDCATGNGQAALGLAEHFHSVVATDASRQQIGNAFPHARISYRVASADSSGLLPHSVALVTVAQAFHWFERAEFYAEVN